MEMEEPNLRYAHTIQKLDVNAALLLSIETLYEMAHLVYGEGSNEKIIMNFWVRIPRVRVLRQYDLIILDFTVCINLICYRYKR